MTNAIYSALSGMRAAETSNAVTANNVANVNTPGFKSKLARISELSGGGAAVSSLSVNERDGYPINSGNPKDIAVFGASGDIGDHAAYYGGIAGRFRTDAFGNLFSPAGNLLFTGAGGQVTLDSQGNLFENGELIGSIVPAGGNESFQFTGESILSGFLMGSNVDIASEMVNNNLNLRYFQLNAVTVRTADEMFGALLDMKA